MTLGVEVSSCSAALEKQRHEVSEASWTAILIVGKLQAQEEPLSQKQMGESDWGRHPVFLVWLSCMCTCTYIREHVCMCVHKCTCTPHVDLAGLKSPLGCLHLFFYCHCLTHPFCFSCIPPPPPRLNKPFLDYGDTVMYGLECSPSAWVRSHSHWGR